MLNQTLTTMLLQWARSSHAVIVFPLAIPFVFLALYPGWFFTAPDWLDPFIYTSMGVDYDTSLGMAYYKTSRILWQSLHYVFRNLFSPLVAQYSLHILMQMLLAWLFLHPRLTPLLSFDRIVGQPIPPFMGWLRVGWWN